MNFALARRGDAPQWMVRLNGRGVPARAILIATSIGFLSVVANVISPEKVFLFLLNSSGAVALFVYLLICVSQLVLRRRLERDDPERLRGADVAVPVPDVVRDRRDRRRDRARWRSSADVRSQLWLGLLSVGVVLVAYFVKSARQNARGDAGDGGPPDRLGDSPP